MTLSSQTSVFAVGSPVLVKAEENFPPFQGRVIAVLLLEHGKVGYSVELIYSKTVQSEIGIDQLEATEGTVFSRILTP